MIREILVKLHPPAPIGRIKLHEVEGIVMLPGFKTGTGTDNHGLTGRIRMNRLEGS
jgi:hypothetical protein